MPTRTAPPAAGLRGTVRLPGDKSIAHRAVLLAARAGGTSVVRGLPEGADVRASLAAAAALGARIESRADGVRIVGRGAVLGPPGEVAVDCGNSGTTMRLTAGLVSAGAGTVVLDGDDSLRRRPMGRIAEPLMAMGARVETTDGHAPLRVQGGTLDAVDWTLPVASAQIKSAVLLAGLDARGTTRVREPLPSRDHTERLLVHLGVRLRRDGSVLTLEGGQTLAPVAVTLPGDVSSAAFLVVAALLVPGSKLVLEDVGINPTRTGWLDVLRRMGAAVEIQVTGTEGGEPRGTLRARTSELAGTRITPSDVPGAIDELPVLCVAAALAKGETTLEGAGELRVKESDRLAAIEQLRRMGVSVHTTPDGLVVQGSAGRRLQGANISAGGDHRIAMAFAVAGLVADDGVVVDDPACAEVSFPGFFEQLAALGAGVGPG